jgi:spore coat protein CotH
LIDEKYKGVISIVCICLAVLLVISALFIAPKNQTTAVTKNKEYVLDKDKITNINIDIKEDDWNWLLENATKEEYRSANVTINGETFYNVGVRPKGNSSLSSVARDSNSDRFSLKIDFSQYVKGQNYHGYEKLALNNMMSDATYMKEYLSYDVYNFLGVPVPEYSYSNIKINGEEWGLYLAVEVIEKNFVQKQFGSLEGNLYKPESSEIGGGGMAPGGNFGFQPGNNQGGNAAPAAPGAPNNANRGKQQNRGFGNTGGGANLKYTDDNPSSYSVVKSGAIFKTTTDKEFEKVLDMIKNLNDGTNLEQYLDVEGILKYFAVNTFLVNLDSYSGGMYHNYYLYEKDGKFTIIPWDLNMSFAGFSMGMGGNFGNAASSSSGTQTPVNFPIDKPVTGDLENAPLIGNLLKVDKYKEIYHNYLKKIADEYVNSGVFEASVNKIDNLISEYVKKDATAFYNYDAYKKSIPELITFTKDRTTSVLSQLSGAQPSTTYGNIETKANMSSLGSMQMGGQREGQNVQGNAQVPAVGNQVPNMGGQAPQANDQRQGDGNKRPTNGGAQVPAGGNQRQNVRDQGQQAPQGGQMAQGGPGGNQFPDMGGKMPDFGNIPQENMMEVFNIIRGADINNLTAEQKEKLEALGVDEAMINNFKNMAQGGMPGMPQGNPPAAGAGVSTNLIIQGAAVFVVLCFGLVFVFMFKRRKTISA